MRHTQIHPRRLHQQSTGINALPFSASIANDYRSVAAAFPSLGSRDGRHLKGTGLSGGYVAHNTKAAETNDSRRLLLTVQRYGCVPASKPVKDFRVNGMVQLQRTRFLFEFGGKDKVFRCGMYRVVKSVRSALRGGCKTTIPKPSKSALSGK